MWKPMRNYLIVVSGALNVAFVAMWVVHAASGQASSGPTAARATQHVIWCPLHRELNVSSEQWREIEPRLREFQTAVGELCQHTDAMRAEVIDLIAADKPDAEAIRAKQDEILATKRDIQDLVVRHLLAEREVLEPQQRQQLFAMLRDRSRCAAGPPLSGPPSGGLGRAWQNHDREPE